MVYEADIAGRTAAFLSRTPVVSSIINEMYGPEHQATVDSPLALRAARAADVVTARFVRRFHAITETVADVMAPRLRVGRHKIDVIHRGRDASRFAPRTDEWRRRSREALDVEDRYPVVLALSRQDPQKNLEVLVSAMPKVLGCHPSAILLLAGREGPTTPALHSLVDRLGLSDHVRFLGHRTDTADLLAASDVLAFPSTYEGLGGTLIEAMAVGCPIVCSDLAVLREVTALPDGGTFARFFDPSSAPAVADAISETLLDDPEHSAAMARVRFLDDFEIEGVSEQMVRWYQSIAEAASTEAVVRGNGPVARLARLPGRSIRFVLRRLSYRSTLIRLRYRNRFGRQPVTGDCPVVVSMTTHGDRLEQAYLAIEAIGRGTRRPAKFVLWISEHDAHHIPASLDRLVRRGLAIRPTVDVGPHTKYFPQLTADPQVGVPLVTADDDVLYPPSWLGELYAAWTVAPDDVVCHRAHEYVVEEGSLAPYESWPPCTSASASHADFATGVSGVLYPPAMQQALSQAGLAFQQCCPRADDIWINVVALRSGHRVRQVRSEARLFPLVSGVQADGLHQENNLQGRNDEQIEATYTNNDVNQIMGDRKRASS